MKKGFSSYLTGIFIKECKNRFLCEIKIKNKVELCYIPSSSRLSNFINLNNKLIMLQPIKKKNARTKYALHAVKYRSSFVLLNLSETNRILKHNLSRKIFDFLGPRKKILSEKLVDNYKSDLYIEESDTVIEIKSILSFQKKTFFPTIYSERSVSQLKKIQGLLKQGHKVCYIFISLYSGVKEVYINKQNQEYYTLFQQCRAAGMSVYGFVLQNKGNCSKIKEELLVKV